MKKQIRDMCHKAGLTHYIEQHALFDERVEKLVELVIREINNGYDDDTFQEWLIENGWLRGEGE